MDFVGPLIIIIIILSNTIGFLRIVGPLINNNNNTIEYNRVPTDFVGPLIILTITIGFLWISYDH